MIGLRLDSGARLRGGAAALPEVLPGAQREVLGCVASFMLLADPCCPAEAGRACSPAPSPCRKLGRKLRRLRVPRPTRLLPLRQLPPWQPSLQQPLPPWVRGRCSFCQAPQIPKGSAHALGGNGNLTLLRSHRCATLYVVGSAYDLQRRLRLRP